MNMKSPFAAAAEVISMESLSDCRVMHEIML